MGFEEDGVDFWPSAQPDHMPMDLLLEAQCETCQERRTASRSQHCILFPLSVSWTQSLTCAESPVPQGGRFRLEKSHVNVDCVSKTEAQAISSL